MIWSLSGPTPMDTMAFCAVYQFYPGNRVVENLSPSETIGSARYVTYRVDRRRCSVASRVDTFFLSSRIDSEGQFKGVHTRTGAAPFLRIRKGSRR